MAAMILTFPSSTMPAMKRAGHGQPICGPCGALFGRVVIEISRVVLHGDRRRHDRLDHRADCAGIPGIFGDDVAGCVDGTATGVGQDDDERRSEHSGSYSTVPRVAVSTRLPALRATKSSPRPWPPKISSGGTRLSAQLMMVAQGAW